MELTEDLVSDLVDEHCPKEAHPDQWNLDGLRNAMIPVVTMMGLQFGFLLGGSIVVEKVFNWPGLGRLLVDSVEMRDYPVIQAEVLLFSLEFILINLLVDMLYAAINPAIRYQ